MKKKHALSSIDIDSKTAVCAICGDTDIYVYPSRSPFCATGHRERIRNRSPELKREEGKAWMERNKGRLKRERGVPGRQDNLTNGKVLSDISENQRRTLRGGKVSRKA